MGWSSRLQVFLIIWLVTIVYVGKVSSSHIDVVVLGGTGDLAQKYLWQSFFELFLKYSRDDATFTFYGCGRRDSNEGSTILRSILSTNVKCTDDDSSCHNNREIFIDHVTYQRLKYDQDFQEFGKLLRQSELRDDSKKEGNQQKMNGVIFYAAVPPAAYSTVAERLRQHCYPMSNRTWARIVLEKPFGRDFESSSYITAALSRHYREEEIYIIDHYLGKSIVRQIIPFRALNKDHLEFLLNRDYVERVEIVLKETVGVKGRIEFYDENGVIRDVFQNHLTELLTLVAMDLPANVSSSSDIEKTKIKLLGQIRPVKKKSLLTGQYSEYLEEAKIEKENISESVYTPTFGASLVFVDNIRWWGVPFLLYSGKRLDQRSSYIRIIFKNSLICVSDCNGQNSSTSSGPRQIIFQIGGGHLPYSGVLVTKSLFFPVWPNDMQSIVVTSDINVHGLIPQNFYFSTPTHDHNAYTTLIDDIYKGNRRDFISTEHLLKLWKIWNDVLEESENDYPRIYENVNAKNLDFLLKDESLEFRDQPSKHDDISVKEKMSESFIPSTYLGQNLVCREMLHLNSALSSHILTSAIAAINDRGIFHLALSGGKSPVNLFKLLADNVPSYIWSSVHIWQVDERCVALDDKQSNFQTIDEELLGKIKIPHVNIHPMPVDVVGRYCEHSDNGDKFYENMIRHKVPSLQLDYILLGLGADGHIASIFPFSGVINERNRIVLYTNTSGVKPVHRMSILFPLINRAREVSILVKGKTKHEILRMLENLDSDKNTYPIKGVYPMNGNLTWYIDSAAWFGI